MPTMTMHSLTDGKSDVDRQVPAFLNKLWLMVNDPETNAVIGWTDDGTEFYIRNHSVFYRELLPLFYKHNNMSSFIRQLNMYGFRKLPLPTSGGMRTESDDVIFYHVAFVRGHPELLSQIQRKKSHVRGFPVLDTDCLSVVGDGDSLLQLPSSTPGRVSSQQNSPLLTSLVSSVQTLQKKHNELASQLTRFKTENETLWREVLSLRQKDSKHETAINKLIQFIVPFLVPQQSSRAAAAAASSVATNIGVKRKQLPMLGEASNGTTADTSSSVSQTPAKIGRLSVLPDAPEGSADGSADGVDLQLRSDASPGGPIIHDVTDLLLTDAGNKQAQSSAICADNAATNTLDHGNATSSGPAKNDVNSPWNSGPSSHQQLSTITNGVSGAESSSVALTKPSISSQPPSALVCDALLGDMQSDLDGLRGLFSTSSGGWPDSLISADGINSSGVDSLTTLPSPSSDLLLALPSSSSAPPNVQQSENQQQLMSYSPSVYELLSTASDLFPDLQEVGRDSSTASDSLGGDINLNLTSNSAGADNSFALDTPQLDCMDSQCNAGSNHISMPSLASLQASPAPAVSTTVDTALNTPKARAHDSCSGSGDFSVDDILCELLSDNNATASATPESAVSTATATKTKDPEKPLFFALDMPESRQKSASTTNPGRRSLRLRAAPTGSFRQRYVPVIRVSGGRATVPLKTAKSVTTTNPSNTPAPNKRLALMDEVRKSAK